MKRKSFKKESDKSKAHQELQDETPVVVLFFKEGCGACQAARPAWDQFSSGMAGDPHRIIEIEENAIPEMMMQNIRAFPTYAKFDKESGGKHHVGSLTNADDIYKKLKITRARR